MHEKGFYAPFSPSHNYLSNILVKGANNYRCKIFKGKTFTETELTTALKSAKGGLNRRPLLVNSDSAEDYNLLTVTLAYLLYGKLNVQLPSSLDTIDLKRLRKISVTTRWVQRSFCFTGNRNAWTT